MDEIRKKLNDNATLALWPETAELFGLTRGGVYAAAQKGDIKVLRFGRLLRVPTSWIKAKLELT
jgi:hypothetical protein